MAIWNPNEKSLFIHIPKSAGTSIVTWLKKSTWEEKVISHSNYAQVIKEDPRLKDAFSFAVVRNPWARLVSHYKFHCKTYEDKIDRLLGFGKNIYKKNLLKDVANPRKRSHKYNRLLHSAMCLWTLDKGFKNYVMDDSVNDLVNGTNKWFDMRWTSQSEWINSNTKILKYENLQNDFKFIQQKFKRNDPLPYINRTNKLGRHKQERDTSYRSWYDDELLELTTKKFKRDCDVFEYKF